MNNWLLDWGETIVVALVLALIIRAFFLQVFWIPSGSMEPTLDIGDRIVVNKVTYNFRPPRRFEIIVFRAVPAMGEQKKDLIKRVVGLPEETLEVKDGVININGQPVAEPCTPNRDYGSFGPVTIPADSYFVMGDNRPASADSRFWGFLPRKNVIGKAFLRLWPLTKLNLI
ncbi:MAG: signal peptidase I [Candidatus Saganbacteria bacterium]|nr:signal peptidase I [Candidatus Saganbacteria bacterium]